MVIRRNVDRPDMRRRRFVRATLAAGLGASAAGCASLDGVAGNGPGTFPGSGEGGPARAETSIEAAKAQLGAAARALGEQADGFASDDLSVSFRERQITGHLTQAKTELEGARKHADGEQQRTVRLLSKAVRFLEAATRMMNRAAAGFADLNAGLQYYGDGRYGEAAKSLRAAKSHFAGAREAHGAATERLKPLRSTDREVFTGAQVAELAAAMGRFDAVLATIRPFADGYLAFTLGSRRLFAGLDSYGAENYEKARTAFEAAKAEFDRSRKRFAAAEEAAPPPMKGGVIETTCHAGAFREAAKRFLAAARAAKAGKRRRADEAMKNGRAALQRCGSG